MLSWEQEFFLKEVCNELRRNDGLLSHLFSTVQFNLYSLRISDFSLALCPSPYLSPFSSLISYSLDLSPTLFLKLHSILSLLQRLGGVSLPVPTPFLFLSLSLCFSLFPYFYFSHSVFSLLSLTQVLRIVDLSQRLVPSTAARPSLLLRFVSLAPKSFLVRIRVVLLCVMSQLLGSTIQEKTRSLLGWYDEVRRLHFLKR